MARRTFAAACVLASATGFGPASVSVARTSKLGTATTSKMPEIPASLAEPGLKVPATAWKWPRSWPYGKDGFTKEAELVEQIEGARDLGRRKGREARPAREPSAPVAQAVVCV